MNALSRKTIINSSVANEQGLQWDFGWKKFDKLTEQSMAWPHLANFTCQIFFSEIPLVSFFAGYSSVVNGFITWEFLLHYYSWISS